MLRECVCLLDNREHDFLQLFQFNLLLWLLLSFLHSTVYFSSTAAPKSHLSSKQAVMSLLLPRHPVTSQANIHQPSSYHHASDGYYMNMYVYVCSFTWMGGIATNDTTTSRWPGNSKQTETFHNPIHQPNLCICYMSYSYNLTDMSYTYNIHT